MTKLKVRKLRQPERLCHSLLELPRSILNRQEASKEIKVKLKESRLLKLYQVKQLKENSTKNSAEKNFTEDLKLNEH